MVVYIVMCVQLLDVVEAVFYGVRCCQRRVTCCVVDVWARLTVDIFELQ